MNNITNSLGVLYHPVKAFVVYRQQQTNTDTYVEAYDMDNRGYPINAHPLTVRESTLMAKALDSAASKQSFLQSAGLLKKEVLHINCSSNGFAVWYSDAQWVNLLFTDSLDIPSGTVNIPPLLWKATKDHLYIYALQNDVALDEDTALCYAPFFNLHEDGRVCMGTVNIRIRPDCMLDEFMKLWTEYFFKSYFSHLIREYSPVKGNVVQLWKTLMNTRRKFPIRQLVKNGLTIKDIIQ